MWTRPATRLVPLLFLAVGSQFGCMAAAKQGLYEILGAQGKAIVVNEYDPDVLEQYKSVVFEPVTTTLSEKVCPSRLISKYNEAYRERIAELAAGPYSGGGKALTVKTDVLYFDEKGLLGAAELLARVKVLDGTNLVVDLIARTSSKSFREGGMTALTTENAKVVRRLLMRQKEGEDAKKDDDEKDEKHRRDKKPESDDDDS